MSKHTPGPWVHGFVNDGWGVTPRIKVQNRCLLFVTKADENILPTREDAQLIAAAPELLQCLKRCHPVDIHDGPIPSDCFICATIAKAEGE